MALAEKDKQDIYVSYRLGVNDESVEYTDPIKVRGQITDTTGSSKYTDFGKSIDYDKVIYFDMDAKTQYIDEFSKIWVGFVPTLKDDPNYEIVRYTPIYNGMFMIYVNGIPTNNQDIYYLYNDKIYSIGIKFDSKTLKGSIPLNMYLPIDNDTKIWYREPTDKDDNSYVIKLVKKIKKQDCYLLKFEGVE